LLGFFSGPVSPAEGKPKEKKKEKKLAGSQKCEKGVFESLSKDVAVPLCDAHYPNESAKSGWLILFYEKAEEGIQELMNRVAIDLGNGRRRRARP